MSLQTHAFTQQLRQARQLLCDEPYPRNGDSGYQMKNIEIGEPDAALFRIPDDYEVVDMR